MNEDPSRDSAGEAFQKGVAAGEKRLVKVMVSVGLTEAMVTITAHPLKTISTETKEAIARSMKVFDDEEGESDE